MKLIKKLYVYKDKNGKEKSTYNFYLDFENGSVVAIRQAIQQVNGQTNVKDYYTLSANAILEK